FGPGTVAAARAAGLDDLGENYAQELVAKAPAAGPGARWHYLGAVQRRKVRDLAPLVHLWHTVDRVAAGREIARHAPGAAVLVQVNVTGAAGRAGCSWEDAAGLVDGLRALGLDVRGLMAVAGRDDPRPQFRRLASLARQLGLPELSMGMSDDLEVAVQEGSTMVRIGRDLFGPRPARPPRPVPDLRDLPHYSSAQGDS
ncbi:MAG: alanine racemase, partial [Acidimicrobiales bacterium]